jgi:hypothetical protein
MSGRMEQHSSTNRKISFIQGEKIIKVSFIQEEKALKMCHTGRRNPEDVSYREKKS